MTHTPGAGLEVREFGPRAPADVDGLAELHPELLPKSPVALLGPRFMRGFYYRDLVADGLVRGAIAYVDGEPAGFVTFTLDSDGFMGAGIRRHPVRLVAVMAVAVLAEPFRRVPAVLEARSILAHRSAASDEQRGAEILSLGVRPRFMRQRMGNALLGVGLLEGSVRRLRELGARRVRAVVDEGNTAAMLLYNALGWSVAEGRPGGWRAPGVDFVRELEPA